MVLELDGSGNQLARNVYGTNLLTRTAGSDTYTYMYNGHADVTALLKSNGTIAATYYYDAFGNITDTTGSVNNTITYAGYQYDKETGLYYLNARYYDPKVARFLTEDTYTGNPNDPLSLNLYTYCHNEPVMYTDPTGHYYNFFTGMDDGNGPVVTTITTVNGVGVISGTPRVNSGSSSGGNSSSNGSGTSSSSNEGSNSLNSSTMSTQSATSGQVLVYDQNGKGWCVKEKAANNPLFMYKFGYTRKDTNNVEASYEIPGILLAYNGDGLDLSAYYSGQRIPGDFDGNGIPDHYETYAKGTGKDDIDLSHIKPEDVTRAIAKFLIGNPTNAFATQHPYLTEFLTGVPVIDLFYAAGFVRDDDGIYHARQNWSLQSFEYSGYNDFYDTVFHYATSMEKAPFKFSYNNKDYVLWAWKGDYLNLGAGAEMGIYTRMVVNGTKTDHWLVDQNLAMPMTLTLDYNGKRIISYDPKIVDPQIDGLKGQSTDKWWVTGFNPYYQDKKASELTATYTVNFSNNKGMYKAFYDTWDGVYDSAGNKWTFDKNNYTANLIFREGQGTK